MICTYYTLMTMSTPVCAADQRTPRRHGITRYGVVSLGGVLLSLAFPNEILPASWGDHPSFLIAWIAVLPLLWAVMELPERQARRAGWWYGLCFFFSTLAWMRLFDMLPWLLLSIILACTFSLGIRIVQYMRLPKWLVPFGFALTMSGIEWLRSQSIFGFPWAEFGSSQVDGLPGRMAALGSVYLITFFLLWVGGTILYAVLHRDQPRWLLPVCLLSLVTALAGSWWQTAAKAHQWRRQTDSQLVSVIQPCTQRGLTPRALVTPLSYEELERRKVTLLNLSRSSIADDTLRQHERQLVIWAESALPYPPEYAPEIQAFSMSMENFFIIGAPSDGPRNSAFLFDPNGREIARYDKIHLVPFGEFVPFRSPIAWLRAHNIVPDVRENDIIRGDGWHPILVGSHQFGIGICFESTFPSIARAYANQGAQYLVYITNDAWFHQTSAVRQHFNHARFRAIETGLPVARAAGTGISGFIAPDGAIVHEIPTYVQGTRTMRLPAGTPGTVYTQIGWLFAPLCLAASFLLACRGWWKARRHSS